MAAQTLVDEAYAKADVGSDDVKVGDATAKYNVTKADVAALAEVTEANIGTVVVENGKITSLEYTKSGKTCTYKPADKATNSDGDYNIPKN